MACDSRPKLTSIPTTVNAEKPSFVKPSDSFRQVDQNTSISPAIPRNTHAIGGNPPKNKNSAPPASSMA